MAGGSGELLSRIATGDGHGENSSYFDGWKAYDMNPFDLDNNRDGVIQMGLAENQVRTTLQQLLRLITSVQTNCRQSIGRI
jgi:1-aminocyclopropane-1-carboxylate synthase